MRSQHNTGAGSGALAKKLHLGRVLGLGSWATPLGRVIEGGGWGGATCDATARRRGTGLRRSTSGWRDGGAEGDE